MRSKLFVPASRPEFFAKALAGEADALSFDLEDAVDEAMKDEARRELAKFLAGAGRRHGKTIIVRVNGIATGHFAADIDAVVGSGAVDIVNLPKADTAEELPARRVLREDRRDTLGKNGFIRHVTAKLKPCENVM